MFVSIILHHVTVHITQHRVHISHVSKKKEHSTEVESLRRRTSTRLEDQCINLGNIHVDNDESLSSSWTKSQSIVGRIQEPQLRGSQEFVRHHSEIDLGT